MATLFSRSIGAVPVSIVTEEEHSSEVTVCENALEQGALIVDHVHINPKVITITGQTGNGSGAGIGLAAANWTALVAYQKSRVPFSLVTGLAVYPSMVIEKLSAKRTKNSASILAFTATLKEIKIVGSASAGITPGASPGGQAFNLVSTAIFAGAARIGFSPTIRRGDNVILDVSVDISTPVGRVNVAAAASVGITL